MREHMAVNPLEVRAMSRISFSVSCLLALVTGCGVVLDDGHGGEDDATTTAVDGAEALSAGATVASCAGTGCEGKDPAASGCSADGRTISRANLTRGVGGPVVGLVELRWSDRCETNWSRVTYSGSGGGSLFAAVVDVNSISEDNTVSISGPSTIWSKMAYAPIKCELAYGELDAPNPVAFGRTPCI
jgi:hypothetical protein